MVAGIDLVKTANKHVGETYKLGALAPKDNSKWRGPWDCAEFASWLVFQSVGILVGCVNNSSNPSTADAYSGAWARDADASDRKISIGQAKGFAGAILIRRPSVGGIGHVAISQGDGTTVEAHSEKRGVTNDQVDGRRWDLAMLLPMIAYPVWTSSTVFTPPSGLIVRLTMPPMHGALIRKIQAALKRKGFDPGEVDGIFGPHGEAAVRAFQLQTGLVPDGEVGLRTLAKLGL